MTAQARAIMNEQINYTISILPEISTMFRNPRADLASLRITTESDFIMGAVWASCYLYFSDEYRKRYRRRPTNEEIDEGVEVVYERGQEIREAIHRIVGL